jgi:ferredoxin
MKQVKIDQDECIGCGACVELCPDIFAFDDTENKAYVTTPEGGSEACIDEAIASCPVSCISNEEA